MSATARFLNIYFDRMWCSPITWQMLDVSTPITKATVATRTRLWGYNLARPLRNLYCKWRRLVELTIAMPDKARYGLPLRWKAFSENTTPHQQHWANSVRKSPSNHHTCKIPWCPSSTKESTATRKQLMLNRDKLRLHFTRRATPHDQLKRRPMI